MSTDEKHNHNNHSDFRKAGACCACHRHKHDDEDVDISQEMDASYAALFTSLQKGVKILRVILLVLIIVFAISNIFWVEEGNVAIQTRFGRIIETNGSATIPPGGPRYALPYPIDKIIKIPTTIQTVVINKAFWTSKVNSSNSAVAQGGDKYENRPARESLVPGEDGSLITGDKNIVQGVWSVSFKLHYSHENIAHDNSSVLFLKNVGSMDKAAILVRNIVEEAIVKSIANLNVEDFIKGKIDNNQIKKYADSALKKMHAGIEIAQVTPERYAVPKILTEAFQAVNKAQSEKASKIESAKRYRVAVLNDAVGAKYADIINAITSYEEDCENRLLDRKAADEKKISLLLTSSDAGGHVSEIINKAKLDKTQTVEFVKGSSHRFSLLLKQYNETPVILKNRLLEDAFQTIFSGNVKTYYLPHDKKKTIYLQVSE